MKYSSETGQNIYVRSDLDQKIYARFAFNQQIFSDSDPIRKQAIFEPDQKFFIDPDRFWKYAISDSDHNIWRIRIIIQAGYLDNLAISDPDPI